MIFRHRVRCYFLGDDLEYTMRDRCYKLLYVIQHGEDQVLNTHFIDRFNQYEFVPWPGVIFNAQRIEAFFTRNGDFSPAHKGHLTVGDLAGHIPKVNDAPDPVFFHGFRFNQNMSTIIGQEPQRVPNPYACEFIGVRPDGFNSCIIKRRHLRKKGEVQVTRQMYTYINVDAIFSLVSLYDFEEDDLTNYLKLKNAVKSTLLYVPKGTEEATIWYTFAFVNAVVRPRVWISQIDTLKHYQAPSY